MSAIRSRDEVEGWPAAGQAGEPVDPTPWTYVWRADREVQEQPEAHFIPRRLARLDRVYRTAREALPEAELRSIYYEMPDLLTPLPPPPRGELQVGLLWTGGLADYEVVLQWPADQPIPAPEAVEVRAYPTSFGWFGWTVDRVLGGPAPSPDGRTWTYRPRPGEQMDAAYSARVGAATEMVAVFCEPGGRAPVPGVRLVGPSLGAWRRADVEIEWGFQAGAEARDFDARLEPHVARIGPLSPLPGDRRGVVVPLLYAPDSRPGLDSRITLRSEAGDFTFRIADLDRGPILVPRPGVFITWAESGQTARQYAGEVEARRVKSIRQMTREHGEAVSWKEAMEEVRLWTCPEGTVLAPFPPVPDPPMRVELSDEGWTAAWRAASHQLTGKHMWGGLAFEVGRVAHEMDLIGLHAEADRVYEHFLKAPGAKPDGDYADGDGALEWATSMRHDMGYSHDGTHASTGRLLFAMAERYFLTGEAQWLRDRRARLQAAADWIVRQRRGYLAEAPNRSDFFAAGLMPPCMLGDYALPACDWHWYYVDNALALQGLRRFAEALGELDPDAGQAYGQEAEAFRQDLRRAVTREAALAPVRRGRDGMYHSFIPRMAYAGGLTGPELGAPQFPECDLWMGGLPLAEPFAALAADDPRLVDTLTLMEEMGTSDSAVQAREEARRQKGLAVEDAWFWTSYSMLPKASHTASIYLLQDDVPGFLRFWTNAYASMVGADGRLWEHWHLGSLEPCSAPDNGTAGWFMECFRNLLVMEEDATLWIARATPRSWLAQGRRIRVEGAPTYFGETAYEIVSEVDSGRIVATMQVPDRRRPESVTLWLRHPKAAPIREVTVNGRQWDRFDADRETIQLIWPEGQVGVVARY
ncbi:MAG: hypothetical protein ABIL09_29210 [Gemmatimonadota bacterium]